MSYSTGFGALKDAVDKSRGVSDGPPTTFYTWKDGESRIVRFVSDEPVTIGFHSWFRCPDGKRRDFACGNQLQGDARHDCPICKMTYTDEKTGKEKNYWPSTQSIGLAIEREPILERGRMVGAKDKIREEPVTFKMGDEELSFSDLPHLGMMKQSIGNFWDQLAGYYARFGTIMDRDYEITRRGEKTDTKYTIVALEPEDDLRVMDGKFTDVEKTRELIQTRYEKSIAAHSSPVEYIERMGNAKRYESLLSEKPDSSESDGESSNKEESAAMSSFEQRLKAFGKK